MSGKTEGDPYKLIVIIHCLETLVQMMWSCVCVTKQHN